MTDILSSALIKEMRYSLVKCIKMIPTVDQLNAYTIAKSIQNTIKYYIKYSDVFDTNVPKIIHNVATISQKIYLKYSKLSDENVV